MAVEPVRLGLPRKDVGKWGAITNKFLRVSHKEDGTQKGSSLYFVADTGLELLAPGNDDGDNGNFLISVNAAGHLIFSVKEAGEWKQTGPTIRGS